jgi:2-polyprenyl-3-methyl-5-hydroxy-6-metoxy-1,4-benzoquinol methylase
MAMKFTDRLLQRWRIAKVRPFIAPGARVLDIGCADGALFAALGNSVGAGSLGVDPTLREPLAVNGCALLPGFFPQAVPADAGPFDVVTMLAVLEHFPQSSHASLRSGCERFLRPGGKLLITVPSPQVDRLLVLLKSLRLVDGMSLEEHHGFKVGRTVEIFPPQQFQMVLRRRFQLGLNNLFVFERLGAESNRKT